MVCDFVAVGPGTCSRRHTISSVCNDTCPLPSAAPFIYSWWSCMGSSDITLNLHACFNGYNLDSEAGNGNTFKPLTASCGGCLSLSLLIQLSRQERTGNLQQNVDSGVHVLCVYWQHEHIIYDLTAEYVKMQALVTVTNDVSIQLKLSNPTYCCPGPRNNMSRFNIVAPIVVC